MALIIGYGSPLRMDDRLGQYLAHKTAHGWEAITCTQLVPELAEPISRAKRVIFIDAEIGKTPGKITCAAVEPQHTNGTFTHHVTPTSLLAAAQSLYGTAPEAIIISVAGASFEYGCTFSPQIRDQLPQVVRHVEAIVKEFFGVAG
jgi:hydrogenase maturation protease